MNELSIEDKARRYDEAIEIAQEINNEHKAQPFDVMLKVFPELIDEDEMIMKEILQSIKDNMIVIHKDKCIAWLEKQLKIKEAMRDVEQKAKAFTKAHAGETSDEILAQMRGVWWSEKQGEQKVANSAKTCKFKVGDWIVPKKPEISHEDYRICQIIKIEDGDYIIESIYSYQGRNSFDFIENTNRLWTIQDARDGDVLVSNQIIILFKNFEEDSDCNFVIAYAGIDISGKLQITNGHWLISNDVKPAAKEQRDLLFQKMKEAGYKWSVKKKELKKDNIE